MKTFYSRTLLGLLIVLVTTSFAVAETRYVSDSLVITVRELPDDTSNRIKNIVTDTPFEVLEESGDYLKVRLQDGTQGYVKTRYTSAETPKPTVIEKLTRENSQLKQQYNELKSRLGEKAAAGVERQKELQTALEALKTDLAQQTADKIRLEKELASLNKQYTDLKNSADNVVQIINQSEKFRADNERMQIEFDALQSENALLLRTAVIKWVFTGAGILFIGWIMGKVSRNKRRYGGV
ncbi:MAG: TIGR04211 family SH3 domain-containing protein [Desulfuromonadales bacterium]|nr:TIGR04211 family SH3 domain-containing protein [Desulfuromonadales bacterium]